VPTDWFRDVVAKSADAAGLGGRAAEAPSVISGSVWYRDRFRKWKL
jgi:hypothetical protein